MTKIRINNNWECYEYLTPTNQHVDPKTITEVIDRDGNVYPVTCRVENVEYSDMGHTYSARRQVLYVKHPFGELALNERSEFYIK
jgi:hypothetical protein